MKLLKIGTCLLVAVMAFQVTAQEKKPAKDPRGPLPTHFGKLGLSDEQKDGMYKIHDDYKAQIDALSAQLKKLQAERLTKLEEKLTPTQKSRLKELRDEDAAKKSATAEKVKAADGAKPAETKKP